MNFWELITGSDMTKEFKSFEQRVEKLPTDYQVAWEKVKASMMQHSDFTGRNLMPILDGVLGLMEESVVDGQSAEEALGVDIAGFTTALAGAEGAQGYRDTWRKQLNEAVYKKLKKQEGQP